MARAGRLVTEKGIGERTDAIWAALQKRQETSSLVRFSPDRTLQRFAKRFDRSSPRTRLPPLLEWVSPASALRPWS